jgi:hypothetical protein
LEFVTGSPHIEFQGEPTLVRGEVIEVHREGRGAWRFPQFETSADFEHGLSGSPVVHDGKICGIVSYATKLKEAPGSSYAASLWPLLLSEVPATVDPSVRSTPVLDLLRNGQIRANEWEAIKARASTVQTGTGQSIATLLPPAEK